ncbi:MAG: GHKL domain-containing protein [Oscillospiraceae bacterium]|nr:GHKL domain-containing protein [Oscillospiraceae bacterium]
MMDLIYSFLGPYTREAFSLGLTFINIQIPIFFFARVLKKGRLFPLRILLSMLAGLGITLLLAVFKTTYDTLPVRVICYLAICGLNLAVTMVCFSDTVMNELLVFCSGSAAYQVTGKLYPLIQNILGFDDKITISLFHYGDIMDWEWLLYFSLQFGMYWLLSIVFRPKTKLVEDNTTKAKVIALSIAVVLIVNVLICISRVYEAESFALNIVVKLFSIGFGFVVLLTCAGILSQSERQQQLAIMNQLWKQDMAQFESVKANMDVINMKCHNLKHIIGKIEGKLTEEEVSSLQEAIQFYDANIKTGNKVLDVVLCEKAMLCQKKGIRFFCMADGEKLAFLTPVQTYTLFGNIIDNAVEAVSRLEDPDNMMISLLCRENGGYLEIEESNYFDGPILLEDNLPATTKEDPSRHGFGIKSIKYIAEQYGGKLTVSIEDNMFFLRIRFPLSPAK